MSALPAHFLDRKCRLCSMLGPKPQTTLALLRLRGLMTCRQEEPLGTVLSEMHRMGRAAELSTIYACCCPFARYPSSLRDMVRGPGLHLSQRPQAPRTVGLEVRDFGFHSCSALSLCDCWQA